ncbi:MAG: glutamine--fructose-6-phosphate transaminase (isomerizing) [Candidatus Gracilibacteria bacterium]|nr:glutamine--fructose-6-phosphate transaminase (isomerizing) [Candidatus Gracilibacteria bacterium]
MCGIFAYKGHQTEAAKLVFDGLKKLEYRGYDSWGVAWKKDQNIQVHKQVGKISEASDEPLLDQGSSIAMSHSRWATHGGVTQENAHPHVSSDGKVTIIHNGIIENYQELKSELGPHNFTSDTDTEVIAELISKHCKEMDFESAVKKSTEELEGRYAFIVMHQDDDKLIAARRGSPLILGVGDGEFFLASDIPAFLQYTQQVNYLDDDQLVVIDTEARFYDLLSDSEIEKRTITIDWTEEEAQKGDYDHFMLKEIMDQKDTVMRAINQNEEEIVKIAEYIKNSSGVFLSGCGTAGKVCMAGKYFFSVISEKHVSFAPSSEFPIYHHFLTPESLLIVISQSGETADVLEAMNVAKEKGAKVLSLVNVQGSSIARQSDFSLLINAGPEKAVASTKAATSQLSLLLLIAYAVAGKLDEGKKLLIETAAMINDMLNPRYLEFIKEVADEIDHAENAYIIGKAANYPMALEAAIKIQEVSYIHAEGFAAGELKHGPIALITEGTPCISLIAEDEVKQDIINNTIELKSRGAHIIGVSAFRHESYDHWIRVPDAGVASPIVNLIPIQLLAYYLSTHRGLNPDMPRNLAKSVTVK